MSISKNKTKKKQQKKSSGIQLFSPGTRRRIMNYNRIHPGDVVPVLNLKSNYPIAIASQNHRRSHLPGSWQQLAVLLVNPGKWGHKIKQDL
jgi:hypothetical protein